MRDIWTLCSHQLGRNSLAIYSAYYREAEWRWTGPGKRDRQTVAISSRVQPRHKSNKDGPQADPHSQIDSQKHRPHSKDLSQVIAAWPKLPAHLKKAVCAIVVDA
jgi:hypothetical protein